MKDAKENENEGKQKWRKTRIENESENSFGNGKESNITHGRRQDKYKTKGRWTQDEGYT